MCTGRSLACTPRAGQGLSGGAVLPARKARPDAERRPVRQRADLLPVIRRAGPALRCRRALNQAALLARSDREGVDDARMPSAPDLRGY